MKVPLESWACLTTGTDLTLVREEREGNGEWSLLSLLLLCWCMYLCISLALYLWRRKINDLI
jgi:hypothetical protein